MGEKSSRMRDKTRRLLDLFYQLPIHVPAGAHVVYLGNVNNELDCYPEIVIQRGSKLWIDSISKGCINCELLL